MAEDYSDLGAVLVPPKKKPEDYSDLGAVPVAKQDYSDLGAIPADEHFENLARDPNFDPALHFAEDPSHERMAEAIAVAKRRANQPTDYVKSALDVAKGFGAAAVTGPYHLAKGVLGAEMNIGTTISPFADPEQVQRAQRENAAAIQLGAYQGSQLPGKLLHKIFSKSDRNLTDQEWEEKIRHEAAQHLVENEIRGGNLVEGGLGEAIGLGRAERTLQTPEELAAQGEPVRPEQVSDAAVLGDPSTYALLPIAEYAYPYISRYITAPTLKTAGKVIETAGKLARPVVGHGRGSLYGLGYALYSHNPIGVVAGVSADLAARNLAPKVGEMLTQAGEEAAGAAPPRGQSIVRKAFKTGAQGAVTGATLGIPFSAAAQNPEEAGAAIGGGFGIGGVLGTIGGIGAAHQIEIAAKADALAQEGRAMNYGFGLDEMSNRWKATLPQAARDIVDVFRARYNGMGDANGIPIQIYVAGGPDYARALQENGGGTATDTRGFISQDRTKVFINADVAKTPGRVNYALGHEVAGHITEFLGEITQAHDISTLQETLRGAIYRPDGRTIPQFEAFKRNYARDKKWSPEYVAEIERRDPRYFEKEYLAEHASKIISGENIANFNLPKPLKDRLIQGASEWLRSQGISPQEGGKIGFDGREIKNITSQMRDILYRHGAESEALRTARGRGETQEPTVASRIAQLEAQTENPPGPTSTTQQAAAYRSAQRELAELRETIGQQNQPQPATANPVQIAAQARIAAREVIPTIKEMFGGNKSDAKRAIDAVQAEASSPITKAADLLHAVIVRSNRLKTSNEEIEVQKGRGSDQKAQGTGGAGIQPVPIGSGESISHPGAQSITTDANPNQMVGEGRILRVNEAADLRNAGIRSEAILRMSPSQRAEALKEALIEQQELDAANKEADAADIATLKRAGYSDDSIAAMSSDDRFDAAVKIRAQERQTKTSQPENEQAPPPPNEPIPSSAEPQVASAVGAEIAPEPTQISEADVAEIAAKAETDVKAARTAKHSASTLPKAVSDAQIDAVANAHAQTVPLNYEGVRLRQDATGKQTIEGKFNPSRPFDSFLLKMADLSEKAKGILFDLQNRIGQTTTVNYGHAPETEANVTQESRKRAQKEHSAEARAAGEAPTQAEDKNFIPLGIRFNKGKENPSITILGASPEKLLNNFNLISREMERLQEPVPYRKITEEGGIDPAFVMDMKHLAENHDNGFTFDGRRIQGFPDTPIPNPKEGFKPHVIPKERFEFLNMVLGDESAKVNKRKTPESQLKQSLAVANNIAMSAQGEVNALREGINLANPDLKDADGNPITWSKQNIENPLSEALRVDLINEIKPEVSNEDASIRPHGYVGDIGRFFVEGSPSRTFTAAGFLPDESTPKTTQERARERMAIHTAQFLPTPEPVKEISDKLGLKYDGPFGGILHQFTTTKDIGNLPPNATFTVRELTPEAIEKKIADKQATVEKLKQQGGQFLPDEKSDYPIRIGSVNEDGTVKSVVGTGLHKDYGMGRDNYRWRFDQKTGELFFWDQHIPEMIRDEVRDHIEKKGGKIKKVTSLYLGVDPNSEEGGAILNAEGRAHGYFLPDEKSEPFFSTLTRTIQSIPQETMTVGQALANIRKGTKQDEIKMSGIETDPLSPLAGKKPGEKVSKAELQSYAIERQAKVQDVVLKDRPVTETTELQDRYKAYALENFGKSVGELTWKERVKMSGDVAQQMHDERKPTHFSQYQLPGADEGSYREMFVTWPEIHQQSTDVPSGFELKPSEFGNDTWDVFRDGKKVNGSLGGKDRAAAWARASIGAKLTLPPVIKQWNDGHSQYSDIANPIVRIRRNIRTDANGGKTYFIEEIQGPSKTEQEKMPPELRKRIYEIGMKRALRDAVDEGADSLSWTTGEIQSERYDLSKHFSSIRAEKTQDGEYQITGRDPEGEAILSKAFTESELPDAVGKELAYKIVEESDANPDGKEYSGLDLKVGGEGLKRLYDQTLPRIANELAKKFGVKVGETAIDAGDFKVNRDSKNPPFRLEKKGSPDIISRHATAEEAWAEAERLGNQKVHSLPIPEELKSQQRQGNALFLPDEQKPPRGVQTSVKQNATPDAGIYHAHGKTIDVSADTAQLPEGATLVQDGGIWTVRDRDWKILAATGSRTGSIQQAIESRSDRTKRMANERIQSRK